MIRRFHALRGALFLAIAVAAMIAGCSSRARAPADATLVVAVAGGPLSLDPRVATDAEGDKISHLICDGLLGRDDALNLVPLLAGRIERISDTSYRFFLRPDVRFHDGTPLTADDVVWTFRSIVDGNVVSPFKEALEGMREVVAEAPEVVRIDLKAPFAPFLSRLTLGIVSKAAAEEKGEAFGRSPVCAGPYRFVRMVPDAVVELAANSDYFGGPPRTARLTFQVVKDDNVRALKLVKGDVDLVQNGISPALLDGLRGRPDLAIGEAAGTVAGYLGFNLTDPILAKREVRQAIALAIDRDAIIAHRWRGLAVKANSILSPDNWAADRDLAPIPYDPARAAALLDEAGFPDPDGAGPKKRFELTFKTSTVRDRIDIARMIAGQLANVGIGVRVAPYEWGTFYRDIRRGNFQLYTLSWVGVTEPDIFYDTCHSSQVPPAGMNRGRYKSAEVDRLVGEGRVQMDEGKRREIYAKVQRFLLEDLPFVPLWHEENVVVYRKGLKGVHLRPDASYRVWVNIEKPGTH